MGRPKTGGKDFVKGHAGGPGRPPMSPEQKAMRRLNKTEFERIANRFLFATDKDQAQLLLDPDMTMIEHAIQAILAAARTHGDHARMEWFLSRLIGKVKDQVEISTPKPFVIERRDGSQLELGAKLEDEAG